MKIYAPELLLLRVVIFATAKVESEVNHGAGGKPPTGTLTIILHLSLQL